MATTETDPQTFVQTYLNRINDHDFSVVEEYHADDFGTDIARKGTDESASDVDGIGAIFEEYHAAFPDVHYELDEMVADGDEIAMFVTVTGTHEGEFRGVAPTGNSIDVEGTFLWKLRDGEITEFRPLMDMLGLYEAIGVELAK